MSKSHVLQCLCPYNVTNDMMLEAILAMQIVVEASTLWCRVQAAVNQMSCRGRRVIGKGKTEAISRQVGDRWESEQGRVGWISDSPSTGCRLWSVGATPLIGEGSLLGLGY